MGYEGWRKQSTGCPEKQGCWGQLSTNWEGELETDWKEDEEAATYGDERNLVEQPGGGTSHEPSLDSMSEGLNTLLQEGLTREV